LCITCRFTAKPRASVTWLRGVSESPDASIILIISSDTYSGPYTIPTSTMSWKTQDENIRRTVSDNYTCKTVNSVGMDISEIMYLDVHCE
jgi:hypothetical protein